MKKIKLPLTDGEAEYKITEDTELNAIFVGRGVEQLHSKVRIKHSIPNLKSRINIKAVVFDEAKFDFEGILQIDKGATSTDTYLKVDCLVVGDKATARAIPSLEIKESEVKGGHGATIGYLDEEQLYYLKSKGLGKKISEKLLIDAFISS